MNSGFPMVALGELLTKSDNLIDIGPDKQYKQITVKLWGKGVALRSEVSGSEIASIRQVQVEREQFILSKIDARNGAFGLIPDSLDGALVSPDFPVFSVNYSRILPKFLNWMSKTSSFVELCKASSEGTTNRVRLQEARFLSSEIPLPPLEEQLRIVARIEELAAKVEEARGLRKEAVDEIGIILDSAIGLTFEKIEPIEYKLLSKVTSKIGSGSTPLGGRASYPDSGIPFIRSLNVRMREFQWEGIAYIDQAIHEFMKGTQVKKNDVLLNITGASIGRVACLPEELNEANVNQHVSIIRPIEILDSRYLMYWLSQPMIQDFINKEQKGATRQGFTKAQIGSFSIPILPLPEQRSTVTYLDDLQARVDAVKRLQTEMRAELDALLPSILDKAFRGELV